MIPGRPDLIITRHQGAVDWIHRVYPDWIGIPVVPEVNIDMVAGKIVVGNIPLHLASHCDWVGAIEFAGAPPRGAEYGISEMTAAGARIAWYVVLCESEAMGELGIVSPEQALAQMDSMIAEGK